MQRLEVIINDCNKECDTTFDQLGAKANAMPEMIQEAIKPLVKMATDAVEERKREKPKRKMNWTVVFQSSIQNQRT